MRTKTAREPGAADLRRVLAEFPLPTGYAAVLEGNFRAQEEAACTIWLLSVVSLLMVFVVLRQRYQSSALALVVMGNIPLALVGSVAALSIAGLPLSVNGIGVSEAAFVVLYGQAGLPAEVALAAALLRRVLITLAALVGAPLWLAERGGPGRAGAGPQHPGTVKGAG